MKVCVHCTALREIFGAKKGEVIPEWRILHNKELYDLYFSINVIWESRGAYRGLVGRPEGKKARGGRRRRWEDNIKRDHREVMDWIDLSQDRNV